MLLASYGDQNDEWLVGRQVEWGASGIITDSVKSVYGERNDEKTRNLTRRQPSTTHLKPLRTSGSVLKRISQAFQGVPTIIEKDQDGLKRIHSTLNAASAAEMLHKMELENIMLSEWYELDDQAERTLKTRTQINATVWNGFSDLSTQMLLTEANITTVSAAMMADHARTSSVNW